MSLKTLLTPGAEDLPWNNLHANSVTLSANASSKLIFSYIYLNTNTAVDGDEVPVQLEDWTAEPELDPNGFYDPTSKDFVVPYGQDGIYKIDAMITLIDSYPTDGSYRLAYIYHNQPGLHVYDSFMVTQPLQSGVFAGLSTFSISAVARLQAGDSIGLSIQSNAGAGNFINIMESNSAVIGAVNTRCTSLSLLKLA